MSRSLIAGLLIAPVLVAAPVPKDDTDAGRMNRIYGSVHDPHKGAEFRPSGNSLQITVPQERRLLSAERKVFNAPRVWREVEGDFTVTVRAAFPIRSDIAAKQGPYSQSHAGGGLVVWLDPENFLTATRDERPFGGKEAEYFRGEAVIADRRRSDAELAEIGQSGSLRVQRKGKEFAVRYSTDGKEWKSLCSHKVEWGEKVKVGVIAENDFRAPFEIMFDGYTLTLAK
jgi:regulation of enolase protein 1 (concanavalin A-like superfamily)